MIQRAKDMPGGSPTQRFVMFILADCHNELSGRCDPSSDYLIRMTGFSNRAIWTAIEDLERSGNLTVNRRKGARNSYDLHPKTCEPPSHVNGAQPVNLLHRTCEPPSKTCEPPSHKPESTVKKRGRGAARPATPKITKAQKLAEEARQTTAGIEIPEKLRTDDFRKEWTDFCGLREDLALTKSVAWTPRAATATLRQLEVLGHEWAVIELRHSVSKSYRGIFPDQSRNPSDVRSQPMTTKRESAKDFFS